jgi:maltose/maltodextrin transport system permease protein
MKAKKSTFRHVTAHLFLIGFIAIVTVPFLLVLATSLKKGNFAPTTLLPVPFSFEHWKYVLGIPYTEIANASTGATHTVLAATAPVRWLWNSIQVSAVSAAGIILISGSAAYAFARLRFKFRNMTLNGLLILQMFPMVLQLTAFYTILNFTGSYVRWLGLDTHAGLIMVYLGGISSYIWMIKGYFDTVPQSLEEAARIDGATSFQVFLQILLPISLPIFSIVFLLSFIGNLSEYPVASIVLSSSHQWTLAVGAGSFIQHQPQLWGHFAALAVLSGVPITVLFLLCQRFVIGGLTTGGVKE